MLMSYTHMSAATIAAPWTTACPWEISDDQS